MSKNKTWKDKYCTITTVSIHDVSIVDTLALKLLSTIFGPFSTHVLHNMEQNFLLTCNKSLHSVFSSEFLKLSRPIKTSTHYTRQSNASSLDWQQYSFRMESIESKQNVSNRISYKYFKMEWCLSVNHVKLNRLGWFFAQRWSIYQNKTMTLSFIGILLRFKMASLMVSIATELVERFCLINRLYY